MPTPLICSSKTSCTIYDTAQTSMAKPAAESRYTALTGSIRSVIFSPINLVRQLMSKTQDPTHDAKLVEVLSEGNVYKSESENMLLSPHSDGVGKSPAHQSNKNISQKQAVLFGLLTLGATAGAGGLIYSAYRHNSGSEMAGATNATIPEPWTPHPLAPVIDTATQIAMRDRRHTDSCPPQPVQKKCQDAATIQAKQDITVNKMWILMGSEYCECPADTFSPADPHALNLDGTETLKERLAQHNLISSDRTTEKTG